MSGVPASSPLRPRGHLSAWLAAAVLIPPAPAAAQDSVALPLPTLEAVPSNLEAVEVERSRTCVATIARVEELNQVLQPIGSRAERARILLEAIILEERSIMEDLDRGDPLEAEIHAWFVADGRLAQSYLDSGNEDLQRQRTVGREAIKGRVQGVIEAAQSDAQSTLEGAGDIEAMVGECDGAILVRSAVLEACAIQESPVCERASLPPDSALPYRFVDNAADLWSVEEIRPWSAPQSLVVGADGSLGGARSVVLSRRGNAAVSVAFSPLIQQRSEIEESAAAELDALLDTLDVEFEHPEIIFAPALAIRATLPRPLGEETRYILHFGPPDTADVVWVGSAGSGSVLDDLVVVGPRHIQSLISGSPLSFTAIIDQEEGEEGEFAAEIGFVIGLNSVNQVQSTGALIGYMVGQLPGELMRLFPVGSAGSGPPS